MLSYENISSVGKAPSYPGNARCSPVTCASGTLVNLSSHSPLKSRRGDREAVSAHASRKGIRQSMSRQGELSGKGEPEARRKDRVLPFLAESAIDLKPTVICILI